MAEAHPPRSMWPRTSARKAKSLVASEVAEYLKFSRQAMLIRVEIGFEDCEHTVEVAQLALRVRVKLRFDGYSGMQCSVGRIGRDTTGGVAGCGLWWGP